MISSAKLSIRHALVEQVLPRPHFEQRVTASQAPDLHSAAAEPSFESVSCSSRTRFLKQHATSELTINIRIETTLGVLR